MGGEALFGMRTMWLDCCRSGIDIRVVQLSRRNELWRFLSLSLQALAKGGSTLSLG
jgi:hypothetical protein